MVMLQKYFMFHCIQGAGPTGALHRRGPGQHRSPSQPARPDIQCAVAETRLPLLDGVLGCRKPLSITRKFDFTGKSDILVMVKL